MQAAAYSDKLAAESVDTAGVHFGTEAEPVVVFVCTAVMLAPADTVSVVSEAVPRKNSGFA